MALFMPHSANPNARVVLLTSLRAVTGTAQSAVSAAGIAANHPVPRTTTAGSSTAPPRRQNQCKVASGPPRSLLLRRAPVPLHQQSARHKPRSGSGVVVHRAERAEVVVRRRAALQAPMRGPSRAPDASLRTTAVCPALSGTTGDRQRDTVCCCTLCLKQEDLLIRRCLWQEYTRGFAA